VASGGKPGSGGASASVRWGGTSAPATRNICAAESHTAEPSPVDIYILPDQSTSMTNKPKRPDALGSSHGRSAIFLKAPQASGIGVGIQYFGLGTAPAACNASQYATPTCPSASCLASSPPFQASLAQHYPQSFTPTGAALQVRSNTLGSAALRHRSHSFVVLATDGYPTECDPQSMTGLGDLAAAALNGTPRVFTFVVGIGSLWNLNAVAKAGGTREALIISDTSSSAAQELTSALLSVATAPLACDFPIPTPADGGVAAVSKVNVESRRRTGRKPRSYGC
jgi:hypothetical protein